MKYSVLFLFLILLAASPGYAWWEVRHDTTETYYDNGQLKERWYSAYFTGNEDGFKRHGQYTLWDENGTISEIGEYDYGQKDGLWIKFDPDGKYKEIAEYINDTLHGRYFEYYPDQSIKKHFYYSHGEKCGFCYSGRPNADLFNHPLFLNCDSAFFYIDGEAVFTAMGVDTDYDYKHEWSAYYNAEKNLYIRFDPNMKTFYIGKAKDGKKDGAWVLYDYSGAIRKIDYYVDGLPRKNWSIFDINNPLDTLQRKE